MKSSGPLNPQLRINTLARIKNGGRGGHQTWPHGDKAVKLMVKDKVSRDEQPWVCDVI